VFSKKKRVKCNCHAVMGQKKKIKPNFGLPGELIIRLVTSNFWELLTLRSN
jgi:hypothetical protein